MFENPELLMGEKKRVVVLVSSDPSDLYFAGKLASCLNVVGIFVENHRERSANPIVRLWKLMKLLASPATFYRRVYNELIGIYYDRKATNIAVNEFSLNTTNILQDLNCSVVYTSGIRDINEPVYVDQIKRMRPDIIAVCGTSLVKSQIISIPPKGSLNLHGGLAQKYRGLWTTMWAIYNVEPEYVGATVHYISQGIDDGNIVYQGRPEIEENDNHETLYVKVVKLGAEMMIRAILDIEKECAKSHQLTEKGTLYLKSMVTAQVIAEVWKKVERGIISDYVNKKKEVDKKVELIGPFTVIEK